MGSRQEKRKKEARENLAKVSSDKVINLDSPDSLKIKSLVLRIAGDNNLEGMDILNDDIDTMLTFINSIGA